MSTDILVGIYSIESPTGGVYIGQSHNMKKRFSQYKSLHCKDQPRIYNSLKKYNPENHDFRMLMYFDINTPQHIIDGYEKAYMKLLREAGHELLNIKEGGNGGKHSEETKKKMSILSKERFNDPEYLNRYVGENNHFFGKKHSEETLKIISDKAKLRKRSPDHIKKLNAGRLGKPAWNSGKKIGNGCGCARGVNQYSLDGIFILNYETIRDAEEATGIVHQSIGKCVLGKYKTAGGFIWKNATDKPKKIIKEKNNIPRNGSHVLSRPVQQFDQKMNMINEFPCASEAGRQLNIKANTISAVARGDKGRHTAGGFIWRYKDSGVIG